MIEGDLKDHDIRLYLGMPMYGGMLGENTLHGVLGLQSWTSAQGVGMKLQTMGNESLITRARNTIATMFLDDQNYVGTHLLFVDSDIAFDVESVFKMMSKNKEIISQPYPIKTAKWENLITKNGL